MECWLHEPAFPYMKFVNVSYIVREQNTIKKKLHKIGVCDDLTSSVQSFVNQLASSAISQAVYYITTTNT